MLLKKLLSLGSRDYASSAKDGFRVALIGGGGAVGQSMAMILKLSPLISQLNLYDLAPLDGLALDISHICSSSKVSSFGADKREEALTGSDIVIVCCGRPKTPKTPDPFEVNANIVTDLAKSFATTCPSALIGLITDPINSLLPLLHETMAKEGVGDPNRIFGVPTLDVIRSKTLVGQLIGKNPNDVDIPVIGGNSSETTIPLFSRTTPRVQLSKEQLKSLTQSVKQAESDVVATKFKSSHLSMAFAGSKFTLALCRALKGDKDIVECAYVKSKVADCQYFSTPILLGVNGVEANLGLGKLSDFEQELVKYTVPMLEKDIQRGVNFFQKVNVGQAK